MHQSIEDKYGRQILATIKTAGHYNRWILKLIAPDLTGDIIEIGSGTGNFTALISKINSRLTATDYNQEYLDILHRQFPGLQTFYLDLESPRIPMALYQKFDTAVCLNLLEHIANESVALKNIYDTLKPGGKLIISVPAFKFAFGRVDRSLGHVRRYTKKSLKNSLTRHNFTIESIRYLNFLGLWGWWFNTRVLKRNTIYPWQIRVFEILSRPFLFLENYLPALMGLSVFSLARKT